MRSDLAGRRLASAQSEGGAVNPAPPDKNYVAAAGASINCR
jgi:hypothetical protein